ncbi:MAG TPA: succinyl-diaminopimelate desuccinylase [Anaeromyxobacteraceae bacterium]|nr:succinyl-diaminopimelate desuccinylase [Anaeromyxobacteraceae bacterium]
MEEGLSPHVEEALATRLEALCAIPSPVGHEEALCDELERLTRPRFAAVRRVKNSLAAFVDGPLAGSGRPLLLLCGHLDTVPVHREDAGRPPRRDATRLFAPGASDMKSGLAVAIELALRLPRAQRFCDLALVLYSREEGPFLENELADVLAEVPELGRAELALCLEPTDNVVQVGCVGSIHALVTFRGRPAHSARPWQGENAIHKAGSLLAHLAARPPREAYSGGLGYREVISATRIEGGQARNIVPDRCAVNLNFRFAPDKSLEVASREILELAAGFGGEAELTDRSPACPAFADHPLVRRLAERAGVGLEPKQAWTDVARLYGAGIAAVNFGPGATAQAHQVGEWVELASLSRSYRMLAAFLSP